MAESASGQALSMSCMAQSNPIPKYRLVVISFLQYTKSPYFPVSQHLKQCRNAKLCIGHGVKNIVWLDPFVGVAPRAPQMLRPPSNYKLGDVAVLVAEAQGQPKPKFKYVNQKAGFVVTVLIRTSSYCPYQYVSVYFQTYWHAVHTMRY